MKEISIYDSTLRDGMQGETISFTVADKLKIVTALDRLGVAYIEAGNPDVYKRQAIRRLPQRRTG